MTHCFFLNDTATTEIYTLSLHDALPISLLAYAAAGSAGAEWRWGAALLAGGVALTSHGTKASARAAVNASPEPFSNWTLSLGDRKSTRLNSSHSQISYAVFCLKKKEIDG